MEFESNIDNLLTRKQNGHASRMIYQREGVAPVVQHVAHVIMSSTEVVLLDFSLTVKAAPHECVIRIGQP